MTIIQPEDMTLEEIKEQLALYNRLYYQKRRHEKDFMETKRLSAMKVIKAQSKQPSQESIKAQHTI